MLSNLHTHTSFCDGKDDAEEIVISAIEKGFSSIGFSGHGFTDFDTSYCMKDMPEYIAKIRSLKEKYKKDIQIYLGVEEDSHSHIKRDDFDYIIGSSHYCYVDGKHLAVDNGYDNLRDVLSHYNYDCVKMAHSYYGHFTDYILSRKPDIVGHFDLITKYDEKEAPLFLYNVEYNKIAELYLAKAITSGCIFEVNTGAISRGYRSTPYPAPNLLHILKKHDAPIIVTADSHTKDTIDCNFAETKSMLRDIGFKYTMTMYNGEFIKDEI